MEMETYVEFPAVAASDSYNSFSVLIHLKAPSLISIQIQRNCRVASQNYHDRAPVDIVTVLDVSGSMARTKLSLLKRAMGFVIQNLGPSDRLSVVAFSSTARPLFHLRRMTNSGRQQALQAVNSLIASGGTNIVEGLRKGAKILEERRQKNPVCSIILLPDGQDTNNVSARGSQNRQVQALDYRALLPPSIRRSSQGQAEVPVHVFGFGADHDAASMHSISEVSGGTFSFVEAESVIQDAFAQCIGGLLSVVVQQVQVWFECVNLGVVINSIRAGSYARSISDRGQRGLVDVGDFYAEEERDFLVDVRIPAWGMPVSMDYEFVILRVGCVYKDPILQEVVNVDVNKVVIQRPVTVSLHERILCTEVDRQKNRLKADEAMAEARAMAEQGNLVGVAAVLGNQRKALSESVAAQGLDVLGNQLKADEAMAEARAMAEQGNLVGVAAVLGNQRKALSESVAAQGLDGLCMGLDAELKEMQERMARWQVDEVSGQAYVLSDMSSHSWQRATARGDSTNSTSMVHGYQTLSMVDMLTRSQAMCTSSGGQQNLPPRAPIRPSRSFAGMLQSGNGFQYVYDVDEQHLRFHIRGDFFFTKDRKRRRYGASNQIQVFSVRTKCHDQSVNSNRISCDWRATGR